jgi:hypothetical protein
MKTRGPRTPDGSTGTSQPDASAKSRVKGVSFGKEQAPPPQSGRLTEVEGDVLDNHNNTSFSKRVGTRRERRAGGADPDNELEEHEAIRLTDIAWAAVFTAWQWILHIALPNHVRGNPTNRYGLSDMLVRASS